MRNLNYLLICLCFGAASQTLAVEAPQTPAPATPSPASPAAGAPAQLTGTQLTPVAPAMVSSESTSTASATPAAAATASSEKTDSVRAALVAEQDKRLRGQGYKPVTRNGQLKYCRNEAEIGSRFPRPRCGSADELDQATQNGKDVTEAIQHDTVTHQSN
jgi:hypothetical protein